MARKPNTTTARGYNAGKVTNGPGADKETLKNTAAVPPNAGKPATPAKPKTDDTPTGNVVIAAVASLLPEVNKTFDAILKNKDDANALDQHMAMLCLRQHEAIAAARVNSRPSVPFARMVDINFALTDAGKAWVKDLLGDFIPVRISKPKDSEPDKSKAREWRRQQAKIEAVRRSAKLAIAIGWHGGTSHDWNTELGVMNVNVNVFRPFQPGDTPALRQWKFMDDEAGKMPMDGTEYTLRCKPDDKTNKYLSGARNVSKALETFFRMPEYIAMAKAAGASNTTADNKGADGQRTGEMTKEERAKAIQVFDAFELLEQGGKLLAADKKATDAMTIETFDGKPAAWEALRMFAMLYGKLSTQARERVERANQQRKAG